MEAHDLETIEDLLLSPDERIELIAGDIDLADTLGEG